MIFKVGVKNVVREVLTSAMGTGQTWQADLKSQLGTCVDQQAKKEVTVSDRYLEAAIDPFMALGQKPSEPSTLPPCSNLTVHACL